MSQLKRSKHLKISLEEIKRGTNNFQLCIGKGGYGEVYKGELIISRKPTTVAIKRLNEQHGQGLKEFLTEIQLLSGQKHPNLTYLCGYCDEKNEKIIVYEYAERGSLDKYLRRDNSTYTLTWLQRLKICIGAARGLDYLHNHVGKHQAIIHRDIKSANILIDENWVAKVSDLGLSKLISLAGINRSDVISNACGTHGYCEPEYVNTNIVKKKSDVYSFGMVLFEVLCGKLCTVEDMDGFLLSCSSVKNSYEENKLDDIVDPCLKGEMKLNSMTRFAAIAYRCLHDDREKRPTMGLVVKELRESWKLQISQSSASDLYLTRESQGPSSKPYSKTESASDSYLKTECQSMSSKSYSKLASQSLSSNSEKGSQGLLRCDNVIEIFKQFDLNDDGGLNKVELEALLVARDFDLKLCSQEQISSRADELFHFYEKFIDGDRGLSLAGWLKFFSDSNGDIHSDIEVLRLSYKILEPIPWEWLRSEKARSIFQQFDLNNDGCLNREELAALIVATNSNVQYGDDNIHTTIDDIFSQYEDYIDDEKGVTFNGFFLIYDQHYLELGLGSQAMVYDLHPGNVVWRRRERIRLVMWLTVIIAVFVLLNLILLPLRSQF